MYKIHRFFHELEALHDPPTALYPAPVRTIMCRFYTLSHGRPPYRRITVLSHQRRLRKFILTFFFLMSPIRQSSTRVDQCGTTFRSQGDSSFANQRNLGAGHPSHKHDRLDIPRISHLHPLWAVVPNAMLWFTWERLAQYGFRGRE